MHLKSFKVDNTNTKCWRWDLNRCECMYVCVGHVMCSGQSSWKYGCTKSITHSWKKTGTYKQKRGRNSCHQHKTNEVNNEIRHWFWGKNTNTRCSINLNLCEILGTHIFCCLYGIPWIMRMLEVLKNFCQEKLIENYLVYVDIFKQFWNFEKSFLWNPCITKIIVRTCLPVWNL